MAHQFSKIMFTDLALVVKSEGSNNMAAGQATPDPMGKAITDMLQTVQH